MEQHLIDLGKVLEKLAKANLKVNVEKCLFIKEEVLVLGHLVSKDGIKPNTKKVEAIVKLPPPKDITGVKSFLGVINFYRKFIRDCTSQSEPLMS